ncbi:MAG: VWA domain-containing protein [Myxococcota bacterium]
MKRWPITAGLVVVAIAGVALAPRLSAALALNLPVPTPPPPTPTLIVEEPPELLPNRVEEIKPLPVAQASGHLIVEAGLDRTAVLRDRREERFLTISVRAPKNLGTASRRPVDVAVVMDVSGSMGARGKIAYARKAAKVLAGNLRSGDTYSLITFSDTAKVVIPATQITHVGAVHSAIDRIEEGGSTNLYAGLVAGSEQAKAGLTAKNIGRVVVLSDGKANVGRTDTSSLSRFVGQLSRQGISVSTVGLGLDFDEDRMSHLADVGGGSYDFVDDPRQLQAVFQDELQSIASVVAQQTQLEVRLPPGVEGLEILGWDAARSAEGWTVNIGDVHAGETRKIVARVRVTGSGATSMDVAQVTARYNDVIDQRRAISLASASARLTTNTQVAQTSWDKENAVAANRALGNRQMRDSVTAYQRGDAARAKTLATASAATLRKSAVDFDDANLANEAEDVDNLLLGMGSSAPSSPAGKRQIKQAKEWYIERAR